MIIGEDKIKELKQLDRIEFRQKLDKTKIKNSGLIYSLWSLLIMWSIFATGAIVSGDIALIKLSAILSRFISWIFLIIIVELVFSWVIQSKREKRLKEEYFSIGVKKK